MHTHSTLSRGRWAALLIGAPLLFAAIALPCVPDGGSVTVSMPRPPLPGISPEAPPGCETSWSGNPQAEEHDDASPNDPMGEATPSGDGSSASVEVANSGGDLSGPNGDVVNGGFEGDCIEVEICWPYTTWVPKFKFIPTDTGWTSSVIWIQVEREVCNGGGDLEACPC